MLDLCLNYPDRDADHSQWFQFFGLESEQTIISSWINHQVIEGGALRQITLDHWYKDSVSANSLCLKYV